MSRFAYTLTTILLIAVVTLFTRALPFALFGGRRKPPAAVEYLGKVIPPAAMAMLVVYCLKGISFAAWPFGLPELLAGAAVVLLHLYKRNTLISILGGTALYMFLVQMVFV